MSHIAIRVEGLGKQYRIGKREQYRTLRDTLADGVSTPLRWARCLLSPSSSREKRIPSDLIWALRDVSFEVPQGAVVGVIGRNGAGKSTLLKVLARITEPSEGRVEIRGRVGSLLEVGTGFHPELTGRENVFLNGAILGMRRAEIIRKFAEIVAFAEIDEFVDTPVKHYSSGMYMRLAFSIAAHLEPEILIVDEVLAVGDAEFQKKCIGKMGDVARDGRTVLFVSHNMPTVQSLCERCVLLRRGRVERVGEAASTTMYYLTRDLARAQADVVLTQHPNRMSGSKRLMRHLQISSGSDGAIVRMGQSLSLDVTFHSGDAPIQPVLGVVLKTSSGIPLFGTNNRLVTSSGISRALTNGVIRVSYEQLPLMPGSYLIDLHFGDRQSDLDVILDAARIEVLPADVYGTGKLPPPCAGSFFVPASFEVFAGRNPVAIGIGA